MLYLSLLLVFIVEIWNHHNNKETNMAAKKRAVRVVDNAQLHSLSSVVLYDTSSEELKRVLRRRNSN